LSLFYIFATQTRSLSSIQLLVKKELFHQPSFYFKNIVSSVQLPFKKRYLHFSWGKCPRPARMDGDHGRIGSPGSVSVRMYVQKCAPVYTCNIQVPKHNDT